MDWIKEHKTLAAIIGGAGVGALGLGYMLWNSYSAYDEALSSYDSTVKKLARLEGAPLYPSPENLSKKTASVEAFRTEVDKLQRTLVNLQPKSEPIADTAFQAKLKTLMSETRKRAGVGQPSNEPIDPAKKNESGMLPKDFAFGFETYVNTLPSPETVNDLNDYLDAVNGVVQLALDSGVKKISKLSRSPLPKEKGPTSAQPAAASTDSFIQGNAAQDKSKEQAAPAETAVEARKLQIGIVGDQPAIQAVLNGLASASVMHHFTVVRLIRIENDKLTGPAKGTAVTTTTTPPSGLENTGGDEPKPLDPDAPPTPAGPEVITAPTALPDDAIIVLGNENLHVFLEIDIVNYSAPATATAGK